MSKVAKSCQQLPQVVKSSHNLPSSLPNTSIDILLVSADSLLTSFGSLLASTDSPLTSADSLLNSTNTITNVARAPLFLVVLTNAVAA